MARTYFEIYILCLLTLCFSFVACGTSSEAWHLVKNISIIGYRVLDLDALGVSKWENNFTFIFPII